MQDKFYLDSPRVGDILRVWCLDVRNQDDPSVHQPILSSERLVLVLEIRSRTQCYFSSEDQFDLLVLESDDLGVNCIKTPALFVRRLDQNPPRVSS